MRSILAYTHILCPPPHTTPTPPYLTNYGAMISAARINGEEWGLQGEPTLVVVVVVGAGGLCPFFLPQGLLHSCGSDYGFKPPLSPMMHIKYVSTHLDQHCTKKLSI